MKAVSVALGCLLVWNSSFAGDSLNVQARSQPAPPGSAVISVQSSLAGVKVFCDTVFLGATPLDSAAIASGHHVITFVHPDARNWEYSSIIETVMVHPGERLDRLPVFESLCHITSSPFGATVQLGDSAIGQTPLLLSRTAEGRLLTFSKAGYEKTTLPFHPTDTELHIELHAMEPFRHPKLSAFLAEGRTRSDLPIYLTTSASVVAGVAAAYCKIKADSRYNDYLMNRNPGTLQEVKRLDTLAGISLAASELSLVMLCYFLISR